MFSDCAKGALLAFLTGPETQMSRHPTDHAYMTSCKTIIIPFTLPTTFEVGDIFWALWNIVQQSFYYVSRLVLWPSRLVSSLFHPESKLMVSKSLTAVPKVVLRQGSAHSECFRT